MMRIAFVLGLALTSPAAACGFHMTPVDTALMLVSPLFVLIVGATWLGGVLDLLFVRGKPAARPLAIATLSVGFVQGATMAAMPFGMFTGSQLGNAIVTSTMLAMLFAGPYWAWRCVRASEARGGRLVDRAGSPWFPVFFGTGLALCAISVVPGAALLFSPLIALFAVPMDRGAAREPSVSPLALTSGRCPVCRELVRDRVAECARCHTPHHRECLDFNGRCGIFACEPGEADPTAKKKSLA